MFKNSPKDVSYKKGIELESRIFRASLIRARIWLVSESGENQAIIRHIRLTPVFYPIILIE